MKKLIALLLALVMVLALAACAAKPETEPAKPETTDTKTEETKTEDPAPAEETTGEKMYIPVMAKGFQHQAGSRQGLRGRCQGSRRRDLLRWPRFRD